MLSLASYHVIASEYGSHSKCSIRDSMRVDFRAKVNGSRTNQSAVEHGKILLIWDIKGLELT